MLKLISPATVFLLQHYASYTIPLALKSESNLTKHAHAETIIKRGIGDTVRTNIHIVVAGKKGKSNTIRLGNACTTSLHRIKGR